MKTTNWLLGGLTAIAFTACTNDEWIDDSIQSQLASSEKISVKAYAPRNGNDTRVAFTPDNDANTIALTWQTKESFSVIRGSVNQTFSKETEGNTFEGVLPAVGNGNYYAIYPVNTTTTNATKVPYDLTVQTGSLNSDKTYMYATSSNGTSFSFHHCTAILRATFTGMLQGEDIKQLVITTTKDKINGTIDLTNGTMTGIGSNRITIKFSTPLDPATNPVYIYLPPMTAESKTLTFEVTSASDRVYTATLAGSNGNSIQAGKLYTAEDIALTEKPIPYITFQADATQTLTMSKAVNTLEYSTNGIEWAELSTRTITFGGDKGYLSLRSRKKTGTALNGAYYAQILFGSDDIPVTCTGDIRTLIDYETYTTVSTSEASFANLFKDCKALVIAPDLPLTELSSGCYYYMFSGCSNLIAAPLLPATTLSNNCYNNMFSDCISLTTVPDLPATTLEQSSYCLMFSGCINLSQAPNIAATSLEMSSCSQMFNMCKKLTKAPILYAKKLAHESYMSMFNGCSNLNSVTILATNINSSYALHNWLKGTADKGTVIVAPEMKTVFESIPDIIPNGWTVVEQTSND